MLSSIMRFAAEEGEHAAQTAVDPIIVGVIAFAVLMFLLLLTFGFRSVHTRRR